MTTIALCVVLVVLFGREAVHYCETRATAQERVHERSEALRDRERDRRERAEERTQWFEERTTLLNRIDPEHAQPLPVPATLPNMPQPAHTDEEWWEQNGFEVSNGGS